MRRGKTKLRAVVALMAVVAAPVYAADQAPQKSIPLDCKIGPATRIFGGNPWLIFACTDGHSVVLVSAPGSKAMPFYFIQYWDGAQYKLSGEGTGDKGVTDAAFNEVKSLTPRDIAQLRTEAANMGRGKVAK